MKPALHRSCTIERRCFVRVGSLNLTTGEYTQSNSGRWETRLCGTPLFSDIERVRGVCAACVDGFIHKENEPTEAGFDAIIAAQDVQS